MRYEKTLQGFEYVFEIRPPLTRFQQMAMDVRQYEAHTEAIEISNSKSTRIRG